jgi:2-polyprenyl-3-methyl-5-hydroxy-6-metoxy-1,4-benzoquinol methylase
LKERLKEIYINSVENYFLRATLKKLKVKNIHIDEIKNIESIKNHIIDLNEKFSANIDKNSWFSTIKNQYRLYSSVYRYIRTKEIIQNYVDITKNKVIDFGAGNGVFLEFLNLNGVGIDINRNCVEHMQSIGIEAYTLTELNNTFKNKFDSAFAFEVIEHVENQLMVLNSIYEYIKDSGYFFVSIPYVKKSHIIKKQDEKTATKRLENYHIFELNTRDFKNLITYTNFELVNYIHLNPHQLSSNIFGKLLDRFFRADNPKWTIFILKK